MEAIAVTCSSCQHTMQVPADKAGKKGKCPKCQTAFVVPAASVPAAPIKMLDDDDDPNGGYGVTFEDRIAEAKVKRDVEIAERKRKQEAKKKKGPKLKRKFNVLPEAEAWESVRSGLMFMFVGCMIWILCHGLHGLWVVMGNVESPDFTRFVIQQIQPNRGGQVAIANNFWLLDRLQLYVGMVTGPNFAGFGKALVITTNILFFVQCIAWIAGSFVAMAIPNRFGAVGQLIATTSLGFVNLLTMLFLGLLPILGVFGFIILPLSVPEVALTEYNVERVVPVMVMHANHPFWDNFLTLFVQFFLYLQPILMGIFVQTIGKSIREKKLEDIGATTAQVGFGTFYMMMAFYLLALCGTSPVLCMVVRVVYVVWFCFYFLFIVYVTNSIMAARSVLYIKLNPEGVSLEEMEAAQSASKKKKAKIDDDEDEEDDDDEDEDDDD